MIIVTFDPGITTGVAIYRDGHYRSEEIDSTNLTSIYNYLEYCGDSEPNIAYEDFKHRPGLIKTELYSIQVIGVIRLWASQRELPEPKCWLPATIKAFWTDDKIKALGLWKKGQGHAMDALRVLLKYRMDTDPDWFKDVLRDLH